ncbi:transporter substrate-binding domain-containing protein [Shewanella glacialipiscicola]|uniref:transporter substrate-binding domain-containing protein n=1 Tax=Shewanella glacialipiscicola TaxID=614069 RepID=UPI0021D9BF4E|nr:transporter substrate-binding domain-containing protein [Shewanella glacialipiscicola]MCU7993376.1 transporter substrate-binding domain-containing protein [Shewanella glacialipiscicola]MCU8024693.1 transporter substrate-binding domain-containing protein [Shewanella glacialipiscicola]
MKFLIHLIVILCSGFFCTMGQASSLPTEPLVIVMGEDSFPYQYVDNDGEPTGLLVDLWKEWAKQTQTHVVFVARHWHESLEQLRQHKAQVHIGMGKTQERAQEFDFAEPLADVGTFLYLHKSLQGKKSIKELIPFQVGIVVASSHEVELHRIEPQLVFKRYESREALLAGVAAGEIMVFAGLEGYLKDPASSQVIGANFPNTMRIQIKTMQLAPAVTKGNTALVNKINTGFALLKADFIQQTERRWLGFQRQQSGLVISMQQGVEPFVDIGADGLPHGLYVDMWQLWSEKTGIAIDFMSGDMNSSVDDVRRGLADAHIGYPESDDLKTGLKRAWHLYSLKSRLFLYQQQLTDLNSLKGKRIGVVPTAPYLVELRKALPEVSLRYYDSMDAMVTGARAGDIVGFVAAGAWTSHYLLLNKSWTDFYQYQGLEFATDVYVLTRSDDPGLTERIANGFNSISPQEFANIEQKWMLNPKDHIFTQAEPHVSLSVSEKAYVDGLGELKVGYLKQWPPMEFMDPQGQFSGINSDVVNLLKDQLNLKVTAVAFNDWHSLIKALQKGEVNLAGSVAKTADRQQRLMFSEAYWPSPWALVSQLEQVSLFNIAQLAGQRVAVIEGYHLVAQLMSLEPSLKLVLVPNTQAGLAAVANGNADVFIDKVVILASNLKTGQYPTLKMSLLSDLADQHSHIGVHPQFAPLVPLINKTLALINAQKQQRIYARWVSFSVATDNNQYQQWINYIVLGGIALCLVMAAVLLVNRRLNLEIAQRLIAEKRLQHIANHDALTQLPNRALLDDRLAQALLSHQREQAHFALLFIDIDNFKQINDQYGHPIGDELLVWIAKKFSKVIRGSDTVARFGGDEFVILLNRVQDLDAVTQVADNILQALSNPLIIQGVSVSIAVSIGVVVYPRDGDTAISLLKKADQRMYQAKSDGGRCYRLA